MVEGEEANHTGGARGGTRGLMSCEASGPLGWDLHVLRSESMEPGRAHHIAPATPAVDTTVAGRTEFA